MIGRTDQLELTRRRIERRHTGVFFDNAGKGREWQVGQAVPG